MADARHMLPGFIFDCYMLRAKYDANVAKAIAGGSFAGLLGGRRR